MEADISTLRKTGHFYFALTGSSWVGVQRPHNGGQNLKQCNQR